MGNEAIVLWLSAELAWAYFCTIFVSMLGLLQIVAVQYGQARLRWLPAPLARPLGVLAIVGAVATFYLRYYTLIFVPGPAGLELMLLFGGASAAAVWATRLLHALAVRLQGRTMAYEG